MDIPTVLSEQDILNKFNLSNFVSIPQDKVLALTSLIPFMDPEVAKKIIEQCPEFTKMAVEAVDSSKDVILKSIDSSSSDYNVMCDSYNRTVVVLKDIIAQDNISPDVQMRCLDMIADLMNKIYTKNTENKEFAFGLTKSQLIAISAVIGCTVLLVGGRFILKSPQTNKVAATLGKTLLSAI